LRKRQIQERKMQEKGDMLEAQKLEHLTVQMAKFRKNLESFAEKHKREIKKDPQFRAQFNTMCQKIGVDPLRSGKGFWAELLGVGDFYYELGVQMLQICIASRSVNGGLIELHELYKALCKVRHGQVKISKEDIKMALSKINCLGNGLGIVRIGSKSYVKSVPMELNRDHEDLLTLAEGKGHFTLDYAMEKLRWPKRRTIDAIENLMKESICWVDKQALPEEYWLPSVFNG